jgi:hypothetical protein
MLRHHLCGLYAEGRAGSLDELVEVLRRQHQRKLRSEELRAMWVGGLLLCQLRLRKFCLPWASVCVGGWVDGMTWVDGALLALAFGAHLAVRLALFNAFQKPIVGGPASRALRAT